MFSRFVAVGKLVFVGVVCSSIYTNAKNLHLYRTHNQYGDTIEKSQAPDDGFINVRNMCEHRRSEIKLNKL